MPAATSGISSSGMHCVDASVVVRALVDTSFPAVQVLWAELTAADADLIAPRLLHYELVNVMHRQRHAGRLSPAAAAAGVALLLDLPIGLHDDPRLHHRALELAAEHELSATYDAHYLALADRYRVPLWTCDRRLHEAVGRRLPWVHLVS